MGCGTDDRGLASECGDLIVLHGNCYTLIHSSVKDYLLTSADLPVYLKLQQNAHQRLGLACISYLMFDTFRTGPLLSRAKADAFLSTNPFFKYAANYWAHHVRGPLEDGLYEEKLSEEINSLATCTPVRNLLLQYFHTYLNTEDPINKRLYPFASNTKPLHLLALVNLHKMAEKLRDEERCVEIPDGLGCLALDYALLGRSQKMAVWILGEYKKQQISGRMLTPPPGRYNAPLLAAGYDQGVMLSSI